MVNASFRRFSVPVPTPTFFNSDTILNWQVLTVDSKFTTKTSKTRLVWLQLENFHYKYFSISFPSFRFQAWPHGSLTHGILMYETDFFIREWNILSIHACSCFLSVSFWDDIFELGYGESDSHHRFCTTFLHSFWFLASGVLQNHFHDILFWMDI